MRGLDHLVPPPVVVLICGLAMWAGAGAERAQGLWRGLTMVCALAGVALAVAGFREFRRAGANIDPRRIDRGDVLVTGGVFRFTRNPMYLGMALALLGYALYLARGLELLGPVAFAAYLTRFQILPEEAAMRAKFGASYEEYTRKVRRWL